MEITKREILVSIAIVAILLTTGFLISGAINNHNLEKSQEYTTALQINNDKDLFVYGMKTNVGNAFIYGELITTDPVTYEEIGGEYSFVKKVKERYTEHTREVTKTRIVNGESETYTETEVYYTWDKVDEESIHSTQTTFLGVDFPYGTIPFPTPNHITTKKVSSTVRYVYSGSPTVCVGTVYTKLQDNTIHNARMFHNQNIEDTVNWLSKGFPLPVFWILWVLLIAGAVAGFYWFDNRWLD